MGVFSYIKFLEGNNCAGQLGQFLGMVEFCLSSAHLGYCADVKHHEFPSSFLMKCLIFNGARWKSSLLQLLWGGGVVMALGASVQ